MKARNAIALTAILVAFVITGCASIIHGTTQKVGVSSTPTGAAVTIDNKPLGNTPLFADLSRKNEHIVTIEMPGYDKTELTLTKSVSGWVWGNIVFGGLIGLAVDAISGGLYNLSPEQLNAELRKSDVGVSSTEDGVFVVAVLVPNPMWQKVGTLSSKSVSPLR
jgi:uncharacterized protein YceK